MGALSDLPNIGGTVERQLHEVGIMSDDDLRAVGSKAAWLRILSIDPSACYSRLCALEGAIRGIRWHDLDPETKASPKQFYQQEKNA